MKPSGEQQTSARSNHLLSGNRRVRHHPQATQAAMAALPEFVERRHFADQAIREGRTVASAELLERLASEGESSHGQGVASSVGAGEPTPTRWERAEEVPEDVLESVAETVSIRSLGLYLYQLNSCSLCQYKGRYLEMHGNHPIPRQPQRTGKSALRRLSSLIRELSDDEGDNQPERHSPAVTGDLGDHWRKDFDGYLGLKDQLGEMTLIEWWGAHTFLLSFYCAFF